MFRRQIDRPAINDDDRSLLGATAAALPRQLREGWIVTPETLMRWHRKRIAERWIGTLRRELLDRTIIWNQRQLHRIVVDFIAHYNEHRPHRSLDQQPPRPEDTQDDTADTPTPPLQIVRTSRCDGLINEYRKAA